jgi:hypothetical protein
VEQHAFGGPFVRIGLPALSMALLVLAVVNQWPYGFYTLLRLAVCGSSIFLAAQAQELAKTRWTWIMGTIAILFNPIVPFGLGRDIWVLVDAGAAVIMFVALFRVRPVRQSRMAEG